MRTPLAVSLTLGLVVPLAVGATVSWGSSADTACWDEYNKRGTRFYRTVTPKDLPLGDCSPAASCLWGYDSSGRQNRLYVPFGSDPSTACDDIPTTSVSSTTLAPVAVTPGTGQNGRFETLPVGATLPSDADCSAHVRPMSENRPGNSSANATRGTSSNATYPRVTGNFAGTTDEIIQWAACKWGIDEDWVRAQIVNETNWQQTAMGDFTSSSSACIPGYPIGNYPPQYNGDRDHSNECPESIGLGQVRWLYHQSAFADDNAVKSSAYNLDYTYAVWRECFEGRFPWLNQVEGRGGYAAGDAKGCLGVWFSGRWYTDAANAYISRFDDTLNSRTWEQAAFPPATSVGGVQTITTTPPLFGGATTTSTVATPTTTAAPSTTASPPSTTPPTTSAPTSTTVPPVTTPVQPPANCTSPSGPVAGALPTQAGPVFCDIVNAGPTTFTSGGNSWADDFDHGLSFATMGDGYRTWGPISESVFWRHANHWMVDLDTRSLFAGAVMRPDRTFRFENGRLVVEAVVAAGMDAYGDPIWPEIVVSGASEPTFVGGLYSFDMFPEAPTIGCRLQSSRVPICALKAGNGNAATGGQSRREYEISNFQVAGDTVFGGGPWGGLQNAWRRCAVDDADMVCRDRFRLELTIDTLSLYVNDVLYFQQTGLPALPAELVNGDVYVYFNGMAVRGPQGVARFHWDRLAVN